MEAFERRAEELELHSVMTEESLEGVQVPSHLLRVQLCAGAGPYTHSRAASATHVVKGSLVQNPALPLTTTLCALASRMNWG